VITDQVPSIGCSLVDVGLRRLALALELQNDDRPSHEKHHVGPARLHRKLVLEDRGVDPGVGFSAENLVHLGLKLGNRVVPGADLLGTGVRQKVLQATANHARPRVAEPREVGLPPVVGEIARVVGHGCMSRAYEPGS
jgi:hypothetical protein